MSTTRDASLSASQADMEYSQDGGEEEGEDDLALDLDDNRPVSSSIHVNNMTPPAPRTQSQPRPTSTPGTSFSHATTDTPMSLDIAEDDNAHIIGPDIMHDSQVVADYLSLVHPSAGILRLIRPQPGTPGARSGGGGGAVIFTKVRKQPLGTSALSSPSSSKLQIIEKLVEPWSRRLLDM